MVCLAASASSSCLVMDRFKRLSSSSRLGFCSIRISIARIVNDLLPSGLVGIAGLPYPSLQLARVVAAEDPKLSMESLTPNPSTLGVECCLIGVSACCALELLLKDLVG